MRENAITAYKALSTKNQSRFLARLGLEITVWARAAYLALTAEERLTADLLTGHNELHHKLSAHLMHLLYENELRYPDDVFVNILFDMSKPAKCEEKLAEAFDALHDAYLAKGTCC